MRKTALLLATAMVLTALFNAGIGTVSVAYAAPDDVITLEANFLAELIANGVDTTEPFNSITEGEMASPTLTTLTIDDSLVTDITGIGFATNLTELIVSGTAITSVPAEIGNLTKLTTLEIKNNSLLGNADLPPQLWTLTGLEVLNLYGDGLTSLPADIDSLTNLTELDLQSNELASLPPEISNLTKLETINIWGNRLTSISSSMFSGMTSLGSLDAVENYLDPRDGSSDRTQIDAIKAAHPSAYVVYATQNKCSVTTDFNGGTGTALNTSYYYGESVTLPAAAKDGFVFSGWDTDGDGTVEKAAGDTIAIEPSLDTTTSVHFDAIYGYTVTFKTQSFGTINGGTADIAVNANYNEKVSSVPTVAANSGYEFLGWSDGDSSLHSSSDILAMTPINANKTFTATFQAIGTITTLQPAFKAALIAAGADCIDIDGFITEAELGSKGTLSLTGGGFTDLTGIGYATTLTSLTLGEGDVTALPAEIGNLTLLSSLDISGNPIASVPPEIGNLINLTCLNMHDCGLSVPPSQLPTVTSLTSLNLSDNALTAVPGWMSSLINLTSLNLSGNLLTALPDNCFAALTGLAALNLQSNYLNPGAEYVGLPECKDLSNQHTYAITRNYGGGACVPPDLELKTDYYYGESISLPQASKAKYEFLGWDTDGDGDADTAGAGSAAFTPNPPDSATAKTYTAIYHSSDATLTGIGFTGATISPAFSPTVTAYTITMYDYVSSITLTPSKSHPAAVMTINGSAVASLAVPLASSAATATVTVALTAEDGATTSTYTLTVRRAAAVSLDLTGISRPLGVTWNPVFASGVTSYVALVPYSMGSVTLGVTRANSAATVKINGVAGTSRAISVGLGMSVPVSIVVSSPGTTDKTKTYTVTLKRGTTLSGFSAVPKVGSYYTLSPGGSNRMTFKYTMNGPGSVKLEIYRSGKWVQLMTRTESSAGAKTWNWDGKVYGRYLAIATYKVRIKPTAYGMAGPSSTISVKIVRYPTVTWTSVATTFRATGAVRTLCKFKVNYPTNAAVRVYNSAGRIVAVLNSYTNLYPGVYKTVTWNGRATAGNNASLVAGTLVKTGYYKIRIIVGTKTYTKTIRITR